VVAASLKKNGTITDAIVTPNGLVGV